MSGLWGWLGDRLRSMLGPAPTLSPEQGRERRMNTALRLLSGGGIAMTGLVGIDTYHLALRGAVWPLLYLGLAELGIIAVVMTTYAWLLGRTGLRVHASRDGLEIGDEK